MQLKMNEAKHCIAEAIKAKLVPLIAGSPAVGKSSIVHEIAKEYGLKVIDVRLAQCDPCDLMGFPHIDKDTGKAHYAPMGTFPIVGDEIPEGFNGWLVFLDEFTSASRAVQAAAYKLVLDRMVGEYHLHKNVAIVCAGNLETDGAIVEKMSTALQSRLVHLEVAVDPECWLEWATSHNIDHRITSYIRFKPDNLYTFRPDHTDKTYGSPRTWEFANRFVSKANQVKKDLLPLLAGCLGEGLAREFIGFCSIYADLPTIDQIAANPEGLNMPAEPSILFALSGSIASHSSPEKMENLMKFIFRMPIEFQIVTLREVVRRKKEMLQVPAIQKWITTQATELF